MKRLILLTSILFVSIFSIKAQVPGYVPTSNLEAWWNFSGNTNDATSNGNNLTNNNNASLTADRNGASNTAYQFNGSNQYLLLNSPSFSFGQTNSFTVSCWLYRPTTGYGVAIMHGSGTSGNFIWNFQTSSSGNVQYGTNKQGSAWYWAQSSFPAGQWVHIAATYSNGSMTLYKNGVSVATNTNSHTSVNQTTLPFYVGRGVGGAYFNGKIDDIGVWSSALTSSQIMALYTGCDIGIISQPGNVNATIGANAQFHVNITNSSVTYQWQVKNSGSFQNITNGGQYSGATNDTLMINNVTTANNGEQYRCVLTNGTVCTDTSSFGTLNVCGAMTMQPTNQSVAVNSPAQFTTASNDPQATFQWQILSGGFYNDLTNGIQYQGANNDTLTKSLASMIDNGKTFRCLVTSGSCTDTSEEATLTVYNNIGLEESENNVLIKVYPNPAKDILYIERSESSQVEEFKIINSIGQTVQKGTLKDTDTQLDISKQTPGYYILIVGNEYQQQFLIE